uniref:Putative secreted protein n=1 Tax=Amblyomma parvum TaxID=251391 RepID=A0A023G0G8_AMBPA
MAELYMLICCTLLTLPCFTVGTYYEDNQQDQFWVKWTERKCPNVTFLRSWEGDDRPLGCLCGGMERYLPEWTVCYIDPDSSIEVWRQGKYGPDKYLCPLGKCDKDGNCKSINQFDDCGATWIPK